MRILATTLAALFGLAFGSFLNVCLSRWPGGESVVHPASHCRACGRTLRWWENIPIASWLVLRGRCRTCGSRISWRYPLVELAVGALWAYAVWQTPAAPWEHVRLQIHPYIACALVALRLVFLLVLTALAAFDAESLRLPDWLTLPGIALGFLYACLRNEFHLFYLAPIWCAAVLGAAAFLLLIRWIYRLARRQEGLGLGDVKLMAMLAAWLSLEGVALAFFVGVVLAALVAVAMLTRKRDGERWATAKLPLGTFLCIGGIVSSLWGQELIRAYLRWAGF